MCIRIILKALKGISLNKLFCQYFFLNLRRDELRWDKYEIMQHIKRILERVQDVGCRQPINHYVKIRLNLHMNAITHVTSTPSLPGAADPFTVTRDLDPLSL